MEKIIIILISFILVALGYLLQVLKRDRLHPAKIILYFWAAFIILSMILLWRVNFSFYTLLYLILAIGIYSFSAFIIPVAKSTSRIKINPLAVKKYCLLLPVISIFSSLIVVANSGVDLTRFLTGFSGVVGEFATMRGTTGINYGLFGILSVGSAYFSSWCGGLLLSLERGNDRYVLFALAPIFFIMLIQSAKLILFVGFSMFVSGIVIGGIFGENFRFKMFSIKSSKKSIVFFVVTSAAIGFSFTTREGYSDYKNISELIAMLKYLLSSYLFGPLYAFDDFFKYTIGVKSDSIYLDDFNSGGQYTFNAIFTIFGIYKEFPVGTYSETGYSPGIFETNIFTAFRGLIYDFGVTGSILVMFAIGVIFNISYYFSRRYRNSIAIGIASISIPFGFIIYLISPFMANYLILQAFLIAIFIRIYAKNPV